MVAGNKRTGFCISRCWILISFILDLVLFAAVPACSPTPPLITAVEATPTPPISCNNNELALECPMDMYCLSGVCSPCTRCENQNRLPPPNGECAKGSSECGACVEGFKDYGGLICTDLGTGGSSEDFATPPSRANPIIADNEPNTNDDYPKWYWGLGMGAVACAIGGFGFGMWKCSQMKSPNTSFQRTRQRQVTGSEERGDPRPTSPNHLDHRPSAPLLVTEYAQQSPVVPFAPVTFQPPVVPSHYQPNLGVQIMVNDERREHVPMQPMMQQQPAEPFSTGTGGGAWILQIDQTQQTPPLEVNENGGGIDGNNSSENEQSSSSTTAEEVAGLPELGSRVMEEADVNDNVDNQDIEIREIDEDPEEASAPRNPLGNLQLGELYVEVDINFAVGLFASTDPMQQQPTPSTSSSPLISPLHQRVRYRSQAAGFDPEETAFDFEALGNASHTSSFVSTFSTNDSGTGTGSEDNGTADIDRMVPSQGSQDAGHVVPGSVDPQNETSMYDDDEYLFDEDDIDIEFEDEE